MAPRRRSRKVGLTRMDAALDAMRPLGFPDAVVRKSVRNLLKVYGGDFGWAFVEEAAYKLLIDTILEEQQREVEFEPQERVEESCEQMECAQQERVQNICEQQVFDKDIREEEKFEVEDCLALKDDNSPGELGEPVNFLRGSPSALACLSAQKHKPCYGWISSDEDDNEDFVFSTPAERINPY